MRISDWSSAVCSSDLSELRSALSPDLQDELARLATPFDEEAPSGPELRIAKAQLVGWLEGLFHGIQATLFAQQMAARQQLEQMQQRGLPPGVAQAMQQAGQVPGQPAQPGEEEPRPGTYL